MRELGERGRECSKMGGGNDVMYCLLKDKNVNNKFVPRFPSLSPANPIG